MHDQLGIDCRLAGPERRRDEGGMNTAEYAVGTAAACGFAGLLFVCQDWYGELLRGMLQAAFQEVLWWPPIGW